MALSHVSKVFGVKSATFTKMLSDNVGSAATYSGVTTAVVASPTPTTTSFSVTSATGSTLTVGHAIQIGSQIGVISAISTDAITVSPALPAAPVSADVVTQYASIPLVGMKTLTLTSTEKSVDLRGDNTFLDNDTTYQSGEVEANIAKANLDLMATVHGGTVTDSGTTPNQQTSFSMPKQPTFLPGRLEARCAAVDAPLGDLHIVIWKAKPSTTAMFGFSEEDYAYPKVKFKIVPPNGTSSPIDWVIRETAVPCL